jgi:hypothetical protein
MESNHQFSSIEDIKTPQMPNNLNEMNLCDWLTGIKTAQPDLISLTKDMEVSHNRLDEYWYVIGSRLQKIAKERIYREAGFRSFSAYCSKQLGYSRQHSYKLMKAVQFIDELKEKAHTKEQLIMLYQLFMLGFTKIYLLHSLPLTILKHCLEEGITLPENSRQLEIKLTLQLATACQINRAINHMRNQQVKENPRTENN